MDIVYSKCLRFCFDGSITINGKSYNRWSQLRSTMSQSISSASVSALKVTDQISGAGDSTSAAPSEASSSAVATSLLQTLGKITGKDE
eukprot:2887906-Pyramimonas_sp.AAC.1